MEFETLVNPPQLIFDQIVRWASATEDWPIQYENYQFWLKHFDRFWLFTTIEKGTNNFVASISLARWDVANDTPLYCLALFYCVPQYRGRSIGRRLFEKVMKIVGKCHNATLTGVVKMSEKYERVFGFDKCAPFWHNTSYIKLETLEIPRVSTKKCLIKNWFDVDSDLLHAYDLTICSRDRRKIQRGWFRMKNSFTKVIIDKTTLRIIGYATIRIVTNNKLSAAPFYAENLSAARVLLAELLRQIPDVTTYSSIGFLHPAINADVGRLLRGFTTKPSNVFTTPSVRSQFTKFFIESPNEKVYGITDDCGHQFV